MRVVIADDAVLVRAGVVHLLTTSGVDVVAECGDAATLIKAVALEDPDVAVIDIRMPPTYTDEGIIAARHVREVYPRTSVLVLSQYLQPLYARRLMADSPGHTGYLLKEKVHDIEVLLSAMERVVAGSCVVDDSIVKTILGHRDHLGSLASLTDREAEVLALMARGLSNSAMATELTLSAKTVEMLVSAVFRKLNLDQSSDVNRRVLAVLEALTR
jgi:DNA-binding NarL/FixJ family response regulator